jgi:hypothetical protein
MLIELMIFKHSVDLEDENSVAIIRGQIFWVVVFFEFIEKIIPKHSFITRPFASLFQIIPGLATER